MMIRKSSSVATRSLRARTTAALLLAAVALVASGCAQEPQKEANEAYKAPVYRTGSNLPSGRESATVSDTTVRDTASLPNSLLPKGMGPRTQ